MKRSGILLSALAAVAAVSGCTTAAYEPNAKVQKVGPAWIISDTASLSHTLVREGDTPFVTCAEPPPDAAFDQGDSADINVSLIKFSGDDGGGDSQNSSEVEMAGRTPAVLIARELFYRACEFSTNFKLNKGEATAIYNKTLDIVSQGWLKEAGQTTVKIGDKVTTSQNDNVTDTSATVTPPAATAAAGTATSATTGTTTGTTTDSSSINEVPSGITSQ